ncbi:MAG: MBL fold metallo-hydrolase [Actinomycetes bacterium]
MRLTIIGCSGSFPGPDSPASCYLVEADGFRVLLDLGNGALGTLAGHIDIYAVDVVLISHLHADHCFDLASFYVARRYHPDGAHPRIPVYGSPGIAARMAEAYGLDRPEGMQQEFDFREWSDGQTYAIGPLTVTVARVAHPVACFAMRIEHDGRSLVYSGDTGASDALVSLAQGADLLLCEASNVEGGDNPPALHLTGREAGEHATKAGVRRLVLTHVPPWYDSARALAEAAPAFHGPVELARPGAAYDV